MVTEREIPIQFLIVCQMDMDTVCDHFSEADKIEWIVRRNAALWYSIIRDKIMTYEKFANRFENQFWSPHIRYKTMRFCVDNLTKNYNNKKHHESHLN